MTDTNSLQCDNHNKDNWRCNLEKGHLGHCVFEGRLDISKQIEGVLIKNDSLLRRLSK